MCRVRKKDKKATTYSIDQYRWVYGDNVWKGIRSLKGFLFWCLVFDPISTPNKSFSIATKLFCLSCCNSSHLINLFCFQTKYLGVKAEHQIPHSCSGCIWPVPGNWSLLWSTVLGTTGLMGTSRSRLETFRVDWVIPSLFKEVTHFQNVYHRLLP